MLNEATLASASVCLQCIVYTLDGMAFVGESRGHVPSKTGAEGSAQLEVHNLNKFSAVHDVK